MSPSATELPDRVGGLLCLDFVNTVDPRSGPDRREFLTSYDAVLAWAADLALDLPRPVSWLRRSALSDPPQSRRAHENVLAAREAMYGVLSASIDGRRVRPGDLAIVNDVLKEATDHYVLLGAPNGGVRDGWTSADDLEQVVWPVVIDAWDLLTVSSLDRVKKCPGDGTCGWLFLDTSRSGTRRWCDMRTCGNREKARSHYRRVNG
jgi:predicted RNA-binding Zn ribbon-like protein